MRRTTTRRRARRPGRCPKCGGKIRESYDGEAGYGNVWCLNKKCGWLYVI